MLAVFLIMCLLILAAWRDFAAFWGGSDGRP
jgi:hypothetical protein